MRNQLFKFFLLVIFSSQAIAQNNSIENVYSPLYLNELTSSDQKWTPLSIKVAKDNDLVFIASGFSGLSVINQVGDSILYTQNLDNNYVESFDISKDGQYIFVGIRTMLFVYKFIFSFNEKNQIINQHFIKLQAYQFPTDILDLEYNESKEILLVAGRDGHIIAYNSSNKQDILQVAQFNTGSDVINNIFLSQDGNWVYVSSDLQGFLMLKLEEEDQNSNNYTLRKFAFYKAGYGVVGLRAFDAVATSDNQYIYAFDFWYGFYHANCEKVIQSSKDLYPVEILFEEYWPFQQISPTCQTLKLNQEETFLYLGVRSQGIFVLDISNRNKIKLFQKIKADSLSYSIEFSKSEDYLYFSNAASIFTFYKNSSNLNDNYPHLFNVHQAKFQELSNVRYKWRCYTDEADEYLIGSFDMSGLYVFPFHQDPYKLDTTVFKSYPDIQVDSIVFDPSGKYMVLPQYFSTDLLGIYQYEPLNSDPGQQDITPMNIKLLKSYSVSETQVTEIIIFSQDRKFAVQTYAIGIILYDSSDIFNMKIISRWMTPEYMLGENQGVCITHNNKWILSTIRLFGVYLLNAEDKSNLTLSNYLVTLGGEGIQISLIYESYAYLMDGIKGFAILDISSLPSIKVLARLSLPGWCVMGLLLQDEQYILVTQMEKGMLTLVDIRDKRFPQIVSSFGYGKQFGFAVCMPHSKNDIFITTSSGIITLPIQSRVKIHTNVSQVFINQITGINKIIKFERTTIKGGLNSPEISNEYIFEIGQIIQFNFAILYPEDEDMHISSIQKYEEGLIIDIPTFFTFDLFQQSLQITVNKELLGSQRVNPNLNIVLLKSVIPLNTDSFIFSAQYAQDKAITNSDQSKQILEYLIEKNLLDSRRIITENFDSTKKLKLDYSLQIQLIDVNKVTTDEFNNIVIQITEKIVLTLMRSSYVNPIKFYVSPSLSINISNTLQFISSNSVDIISITLLINKTDGKLVIQSHPSVISYMSESQDQLKIQGTLENINSALQQKVIFANNSEVTQIASPIITITLSDNINYPLKQQFSISECKFIALKKQLRVNSPNTLQEQINKQFPDSVVDIETDITISFQQDSFIVDDIKEYTYKCFYSADQSQTPESYVELPPDMWLQELSDSRLNFKGTTKSSMYREVYYFKIVAFDGYTKIEDYFTIKVYGIPFAYIMNLLFKILGPVVAILGLYQKRHIFFNMLFQKNVTYSEELAICDYNYRKQIIIIGQVLQDSKIIICQLFSKALSKLSKKKQAEADTGLGKNDAKIIEAFSDIDFQYQSNNFNDDEQYKKFEQTKLYIPINKPDKKNIEKIIQSLKKIKKHKPLTILEKRYLKINGSLNMTQVIEDIQEFDVKLQGNQFKTSQCYSDDIKNINSRIYRAMRAYISRYFLSLDKRSQEIYDYIKYHCFQFIHKSSNDWFKAIASVHYGANEENQEQFKVFPNLELKYQVLFFIFQTLKLFPSEVVDKPKSFSQFTELIESYSVNINLYLIREAIFADVLGFCQYIPSSFQPVVGESIHLNSYDIKQIIAFKKKNLSKWIRPLYRCLNIEYSKYGVSKNMRLPTWLNLDQKHGMIILQGTPQQEDIEDVLIRVYDITGYVIQQYMLKIIPNFLKNSKITSKQNMDQIYTVPDEQDDYVESQYQSVQQNRQTLFNDKQTPGQNSAQCILYNGEESSKTPKMRPNSSFSINYLRQTISKIAPNQNERKIQSPVKNKQMSMLQYQFKKNRNSKNISEESSMEEQNDILQSKNLNSQMISFNETSKNDYLNNFQLEKINLMTENNHNQTLENSITQHYQTKQENADEIIE